MAMKLFAHVLRSEISAADSIWPVAVASLDPRRWVFRDLVVRRDGYAAWGLSPESSAGTAAPALEPAAEPLWPDTQPWCREYERALAHGKGVDGRRSGRGKR